MGYDPCRPLHYVIGAGGPAGSPQLVRDAVAMVSHATGLPFVEEPDRGERPAADRPPYQAERYGERWAPVLVAWSDATETPQLGHSVPDAPLADVAGFAGSRSMGFSRTDPSTGMTVDTGLVFVTGSVVLDREDVSRMMTEADGYARARAVVVHELAHLLGLGHVDDPGQLMNPAARPAVTVLAPGDLEGLARLGTLDCFPQI